MRDELLHRHRLRHGRGDLHHRWCERLLRLPHLDHLPGLRLRGRRGGLLLRVLRPHGRLLGRQPHQRADRRHRLRRHAPPRGPHRGSVHGLLRHAGGRRLGDDFIGGSPATTNLDLLNGEGDSDSIHGDDGDDIIDGGDGDDVLYGEDGDDYIYGGYGDDRIKAGAGEDHAFGEEDTDKVCGGDDADYVYGGDGDGDRVCGEGSTDYLNSGGNGSADGCEPDNYDGSCEGTGQTECPW
ncbi:MAG: hypothetical protein ABIO70_16520 [Pseudomonadota bacterium]